MKHSLLLGGHRVAIMDNKLNYVEFFKIQKGFRTAVKTYAKDHDITWTTRTLRNFPWLNTPIKATTPAVLGVYRVTYEGLWFGGKAVVMACTRGEAIELVKGHTDTVGFTDVKAEIIETDLKTSTVLYNNNGDY